MSDPGGSRLGTLERLVVDESAHTITHLVVGGRVVGVGHFRSGPGDDLVCDLDREQLQAMPDVRHASVTGAPAHWEAPPGYRMESFLRIAGALIGQGPYVPPAHIEVESEAPHEITEGSPVWYQEQRLGEVALVLTDDDGRMTGLVVRHGPLGERRLIDATHVTEVIGNNVHVDMDEQTFKALPRYS